ncbi:MAG: hypothetical protein JW828_04195 [Sedimentisphaerales bacterium]|nr:hypothetical protein [Sedimentisphaerales bacterium]
MSSNATKIIKPLSDWFPEHLRITLFCKGKPETSTIWKDLAGEEALNIISKPKESLTIAEDQWSNGKLRLIVKTEPPLGIARLDLRYERGGTISDDMDILFPLGTCEKAFAEFFEIGNPLPGLKTIDEINRIAIAGTAFLPNESRQKAYEIMQKYIPRVKLDLEDHDFLYRINRRAECSVIEKLLINRLATWSYGKIKANLMQVQEEGPDLPLTEKYADICRCEFDINTSQNFSGPIPKEKISSLMDELKIHTSAILESGDQK